MGRGSPQRVGPAVSLGLVLSTLLDLASGLNVICYATNWPQYRPGQGHFLMSDVDPSKCTHMVFAFAKVTGNRLDNYEENDVGTNGQYMQFTNLKQQYPHIATLLAVGGWNHGGDPFSQMAATPQGRAEFVRTTVPYLRQYNFDGLDVDWEYPQAEDRANLVSLIQELRAAFDADEAAGRSRLYLAMAVAAGLQNARPAYDVPALNRELDFLNVMTYDYHGAWEDVTGLLAPLNAPPGDQLSMTISLDWYLQQGASKDKLHVGLALYGRTWTLANPSNHGIGAPAPDHGTVGRFTREPGVLSHYEVCERVRDGFTTVFDQTGQMNYAYRGDQWITYEDTNSINSKVRFILENGYAGAMIWSFDQDDFKGEFCNQGPYPLMSIVADRLINVGQGRPNAPGGGVNPNAPNQNNPYVPPTGSNQPPSYQPGQNNQQYPYYPPNVQNRPNNPSGSRPTGNQPPQYTGGNQPPQYTGGNQPPQYTGGNQPPQYTGGNQPPQYTGGNQPPQYTGGNQPPQYNSGNQPPQYTGGNQPPQYTGGNQPPVYTSGNQPPQYTTGNQPPQYTSGNQRPNYQQPGYTPPMVSPEEFARREPSQSCPPVPFQTPVGNPMAPVANFACPVPNGKFPDATTCEYYQHCLFQMPFRQRCPRFSQFNPTTRDCECIASSSYRCPFPS